MNAADKSAQHILNRTAHERETAFVIACLRVFFGAPPTQLDGDDGVSVELVQEIARFNGVAGLLAAVSSHWRHLDCADALTGTFDAQRAIAFQRNASLLLECAAIHEELADERIDHVFLKGPLQQQHLYNSPFIKPSLDIDILVPREGFERAKRCLALAGYEIHPRFESSWWRLFLGEQTLVRTQPRPCAIDLHHRVQQPGCPSPRDTGLFVRETRTMTLAGTQFPVPTDRNIALLAGISVVKSLYGRQPSAGYVCDLRACISGLDARAQDMLIGYAEAQGLRETLLLACRACFALLGPREGPLAAAARREMTDLDDTRLVTMVVAPWRAALEWPARRRVLWELCGRSPRRYVAEAAWAGAAEVSRRMAERGGRAHDRAGGPAAKMPAAPADSG